MCPLQGQAQGHCSGDPAGTSWGCLRAVPPPRLGLGCHLQSGCGAQTQPSALGVWGSASSLAGVTGSHWCGPHGRAVATVGEDSFLSHLVSKLWSPRRRAWRMDLAGLARGCRGSHGGEADWLSAAAAGLGPAAQVTGPGLAALGVAAARRGEGWGWVWAQQQSGCAPRRAVREPRLLPGPTPDCALSHRLEASGDPCSELASGCARQSLSCGQSGGTPT